MKREIKFRGIRIDDGKWIYGSLIKDSDFHYRIVVVSNTEPYDWFAVVPETIGQYTGVMDKNGKEVYEGDIMMVLDRDWPSGSGDHKEYMKSISAICGVAFETGCFMLKKIKGGDYYSWDLSKERGRDLFEVIGNIYGNPELV